MVDWLIRVYSGRLILLSLVKNDLKTRYLGSYLGMIWAFVNPLTTVGVLIFVVSFGFKAATDHGAPFAIWLLAGIVPWFFLSEGILTSTSSVLEKTFLVKKVVFDVSLLPVVKIGSALIVHMFFVGVLFGVLLFYGYSPRIMWVQLLYYVFCGVILIQGLAWITSSVIVFVRDVGQAVGVLVQFGFWLTPVFWSIEALPDSARWIIKANPLYYIVNGYRDTFINRVWFWNHWELSIYFWLVTVLIFYSGHRIFVRLRPHFADVV